MKMLVLQWPGSKIEDYDYLIELENALIERCGTEAQIDGHDAADGEMNIFIRTADPKRVFESVIPMLKDKHLWLDVRAAYRDIEGSTYTVIWPDGLRTFRVA